MKSCARWNDKFRYEYDIDELIIKFKPEKEDFGQLTSFLTEHSNQMVILDIQDYDFLLNNQEKVGKNFLMLRNDYHFTNFKIRFDDYWGIKNLISEFLATWFYDDDDNQIIPFYFNTLVQSWDILHGFIKMNVSDILVGNELAFCLPEVKFFCQQHEVAVRAYPNIAQNPFAYNGLPPFFIRPEGMMAYDKYIDVLEFWQYDIDDERFSLTEPNVLYDAYFRKGKWQGVLSDLIINLPQEWDCASAAIHPAFDTRRVKCRKKCATRIEQPCQFCQHCVAFADALSSKGQALKFADSLTWDEIFN